MGLNWRSSQTSSKKSTAKQNKCHKPHTHPPPPPTTVFPPNLPPNQPTLCVGCACWQEQQHQQGGEEEEGRRKEEGGRGRKVALLYGQQLQLSPRPSTITGKRVSSYACSGRADDTTTGGRHPHLAANPAPLQAALKAHRLVALFSFIPSPHQPSASLPLSLLFKGLCSHQLTSFDKAALFQTASTVHQQASPPSTRFFIFFLHATSQLAPTSLFIHASSLPCVLIRFGGHL